jgi:hypothetical protein
MVLQVDLMFMTLPCQEPSRAPHYPLGKKPNSTAHSQDKLGEQDQPSSQHQILGLWPPEC